MIVGIGMVLVPVTAMALRDVQPAHAGAASGGLATAQQVGGALGVAVIGWCSSTNWPMGLRALWRESLGTGRMAVVTAGLVQLLPGYGRLSVPETDCNPRLAA